ncbi:MULTISPECIES: DUF1254 domain-containing protein [Halocynthiibacter]|uniref:DUF1254 domain-containing protein n=1 Tax=Halocynthiibacter halioticoli TaxID=2986804 RepID=A0AAE3LPY4_9RHOB|nr:MULTISPECIES: DUF1254 domain-containing protein [Halocynthiibacter]MCV6822959.1 DUF1254 domain-containing protein [Halocynthiibacter halioticoli]MCW4055960.1 DUF1254 domain-containing protein [Halocynthiibacter sp. SDUM655004]
MPIRNHFRTFALGLGMAGASLIQSIAPAAALTTDEAKSIAEEAAIYGLPMLMNYSVMYQFAIDESSSQYKAPFNQIKNEAQLATPKDTAIVTPNSDTIYSFIWMDLRAEPVVICVPKVEKSRYFSVQLVNLYTYNFGYIGSRTTGNDAGCYAIAGPHWQGDKPDGISEVIRSSTEFGFANFRTQVFGPSDLDKAKAVQEGYKVSTLSAFAKTDAPEPASPVDWMKVDKESMEKDPLGYLAFILQFAPAIGDAAVEKPLREKFASIGIEAGKAFPAKPISDEIKSAIAEGLKAGTKKAHDRKAEVGKMVNGWQISQGLFGDRAMLKDDYLMRAVAALVGLYGNDSAEAFYPLTRLDGKGAKLDGSKTNYTLTFPAGELPPVNAFWSVTMYDGNTQLLVDNPINRYLINAPMLPNMHKDDSGAMTLYIQKDAPTDEALKANWLPAPDGPIYMVMRLYWPKKEALDGSWQPPAITPAK